MTGRTISHYRIGEKLGEGGMGTVYRADDLRLGRTVALKFLRPLAFDSDEEKRRFVREAQLGARLEHPNVCTVYEIDEEDDQVFIAMAYIPGMTLKQRIRAGPIAVDEALHIAMEVSKGLKAAHSLDIVHRDIKSSNIMLGADGHVRITDFGLAKMVDDTEISSVTAAVGSAAYMSPEQARSVPVDARTDIWSLGVVLYEALTGRLPFRADFEAAVVYLILNEEPPRASDLRLEIPPSIERVLARLLAKERDERYGNMDEVLADLEVAKERVLSGVPDDPDATAREPSIAILPFRDMSPDKDQEYLCDGLSEEITNALAKVEGVRVVARTSAFSFKGQDVDIRQIGRRLGVGNLLEGSLRKAGSRLRVTVQLTSADHGYELWSERYDRELDDVFAIQDEITLAIVDKLRVTLLREDKEALVKRYTADPEAFSLYWNGRYYWNKRTEVGYQAALEYFEKAVERDPDYALAHVGIADTYDLLGWYDYISPQEAFPKARAAAHRAMAMDDTLAEAHATAGWICVNYEWAWKCAQREYRRALTLNPGYATAHQWYSEFLSYIGRHEDAIRHGRRALELDPLSIIINSDLGQVLYYAREYDGAIAQFRQALAMDPTFAIAHYFLAFAHIQKGEYEEAVAAAQRVVEFAGDDDTLGVAQVGMVNGFAGHLGPAKEALARLHELAKTRYASPFSISLVHTGLGDIDEAFHWLQRAFNSRDHWLETLRVHPALDRLRDDPRYDELVAKMGFETAGSASRGLS